MIVLTTLLTSTPDPQRGTKWECDPMLVESLARSVIRHGHDLVVLHDEDPICRPDLGRWGRVEREHANPYFDRWRLASEWLDRQADPNAWVVDATDVEMLRDPFITMPIDLAVGSEPGTLNTGIGSDWLRDNHPLYGAALGSLWPERPFYNAGIAGGPRGYITRLAASVYQLANPVDLTDMAAFNLIAHTWPRRVFTGPTIHTEFRANQREHPTALWRHK